MAMRPLGFGRPTAPQPEGDWEAYNAVSQAGQARVVGAIEDRYRAVAALAAPRAARAPQMAQVGYNPRTGKYVVGTEEFDADDPAVIKMFAELEDLPAMPLATGLEGRSLDELKARWQDLYNNAEVDNSLGSIGRGMLEGIAGIPRGIASVFGADVANPYEGGADAWRRDNTTLYEQVGRTMRPTESLVGLGQAGIQAIESGLPVLAAGAAGTALAGPGGGVAAGAAVAGGMAAESQGDEAQARLMQQFARMAPEDFTSNPEYMTLRRAGNDHPTAVDELVRRGRVSAARGGFAIGGISGALAPAASRFAGRALGLGGAAGSRADDAIGDAMLRMMRGGSTGLIATARGAGGSAMVGGTVEGGQEFFETDVSQGLADISAGQSDRYRMGQYGTADDFVGGFVGGAPFGALGGLRTPGAAPSPQPRAGQGGTPDPTLNAAMVGVVAPPTSRADDTRPMYGPWRGMGIGQKYARSPEYGPENRGAAVGESVDMFNGAPRAPAGGPGNSPALEEMQELQRVIPQILLRAQSSRNPQEQQWLEQQLESLRARYMQLEQQAGPLPESEVDPTQQNLLDPRGGYPVQQQGVAGQTPDMFGRAPSEGPSGEFDSIDVADPTGNALGSARDRMAAQYGTQPLFDEEGNPVLPVQVPRSYRRQAEQERQAQRFEDSYNNPALLTDEYTPAAEAPAAMARERDQLERMLEERRAAGFAKDDPVATGIEQRLAAIEQAIGPRGAQADLAFPDTGQTPLDPDQVPDSVIAFDESGDIDPVLGYDARAAADRDAAAAANAKGPTLQMFGPAGGVTPAARVPKNETWEEADKKIKAEIAEMLDPAAGRDAVWISGKGRSVPVGVTLPKTVKEVRTRAGILLTTNKVKARRIQENPSRGENEAEVAKLLNFPINKAENAAAARAGEETVVVEGRDKATGTPTTQMLVPETRVDEGVAAVIKNVNPTKTDVEITTPAASVAERKAMVAAEGNKTPGRPPNPDQAAGAVSVEVAPGRPPEERRQIITEMLAPLQRKIQSKTTSKSEKAKAQAEADQLLAQLDAIDAPAATPQTGGRGPSKGPDRQQSTEEAGRDRTSDTAGRSPEEEAEAVFTREGANAQAARDLAEALEAERRGDEPLDLDVAPTAAPPELRVDGVDAPVLKAAEMAVEVEDGEAQVKPSAMLDWYRKRIENLNLLLACVLK